MPYHSPIHPHNPCRYGVPAKIWELLRRNELFGNAVEDCLKAFALSQNAETEEEIKQRDFILQTLNEMESRTPMYATALRWMIPEVIYELERANGDIGESASPNLKSMNWHPADDIDCSGWIMEIGPRIRMIENGPDVFSEWQQYVNKMGFPNLGRPWAYMPVQFQREIEFHWSCCRLDDGGSQWVTKPMQPDFFKQDLQKLIESQPSDGLNEDALTSIIEFNRIKENFEVFCFPKNIQATASQIRGVFKVWADKICETQGLSKEEIFGTPIEWDAFLFYETEFAETESDKSIDRNERKSIAIYRTIEMVRNPGSMEKDKDILERNRKNFKHYIDSMHTPYTNNGLVNRIFPDLRDCLTY